MGALPCSENRGIDVVLDIIKPDAPCESDPGAIYDPALTKGVTPSGSSDQHALEVARMIAADRNSRGYESAAMIPALFEVKEPGMQDPPNVFIAVHRTTGMVRRLLTVRKPSGAERQERLRALIRQLQALRCDSVARILEVFEDCRTVSLVMEHCSGGTVYDRILQRQYFAEQESAVLIRHILQSLAPLHQNGMGHGQPTPDSFRFHSEAPHAALKLVDFGLDLKVHMWDAADLNSDSAVHDRRRTTCLQFYETCRIVFCAPEVVRPLQVRSKKDRSANAEVTSPSGQLDEDLLAEVIDAHCDNTEECDARKLEAADTWSVGAITFLLLCGYPPFFAPCRHAILARIEKTDYSFDPPFWSKISEEAKDFVQQCLEGDPTQRMSVTQALQHPWIQSLADNSPSGSMLSSFALNLRRFYRTSLIESFAANCLAAKLTLLEMRDLFLRCRETDGGGSGFFTATDLRQVLSGLGHSEIAEAIGMCFSRTLRHPGESYIDYVALIESIRVRRERLLEEELWRCFRQFSPPTGTLELGNDLEGRMPASRLGEFLTVPEIQEALTRDGIKNSEAFILDVQQAMHINSNNGVTGTPEVEFIEVASELIRQLPMWPEQPGAAT